MLLGIGQSPLVAPLLFVDGAGLMGAVGTLFDDTLVFSGGGVADWALSGPDPGSSKSMLVTLLTPRFAFVTDILMGRGVLVVYTNGSHEPCVYVLTDVVHLPSGNSPVLPFCRCLPRYHPSPKSSSRSMSSIRSPLYKLSSSGLRASKSSMIDVLVSLRCFQCFLLRCASNAFHWLCHRKRGTKRSEVDRIAAGTET